MLTNIHNKHKLDKLIKRATLEENGSNCWMKNIDTAVILSFTFKILVKY